MSEYPDFHEEFMSSLNRHLVEYMIFGGYAVNFYGYTRVTEDLDIWINPATTNLERAAQAITDLGFPNEKMLKDFVSGASLLLRIADAEFRIDLMTRLNIKKSFSECYSIAESVDMPYGKIWFLAYPDLIDEKIRSKRPKDLSDIQQLRLIRGE
jgi:hypothetical protein